MGEKPKNFEKILKCNRPRNPCMVQSSCQMEKGSVNRISKNRRLYFMKKMFALTLAAMMLFGSAAMAANTY